MSSDGFDYIYSKSTTGRAYSGESSKSDLDEWLANEYNNKQTTIIL